jgi:hypothetical protein
MKRDVEENCKMKNKKHYLYNCVQLFRCLLVRLCPPQSIWRHFVYFLLA